MQKLPCTLLVDDDQTTNFLNRRLLEKLAVTDKVLVALNGQEALELVATHCQRATPDCPALILLDVKMPVMNGFEFLTAYEQLPAAQRQATVIVMLTTSLHPQDMERIDQLPVAGFLSKPLNEEKINFLLKTHFARELPSS